jgi:hypothetical protein
MKSSIKYYKVFLVIILAWAFHSCQQTDEFIAPSAKMSIVNDNISLLEKLEVKNMGEGQKFSFWTGDAGHNYNQRSSGDNFGLAPNAGNDFVYYYLNAGKYTVVMIASSYDDLTGKFIQKIDSATVTVSGAAVNNFTNFAIKNVWKGYSPSAIINNDSIFVKIAPINRPLYPDSLIAYIANSKPPLFSVAENLDYVTVFDENNTTFKGLGLDTGQLKLFNIIDANTIQSKVKSFTIVDNATQNAHTYKMAAMLYPQLFSFEIEGDTALLFSENGLAQLKQESIVTFYQLHQDSIYIGIFLDRDQDITKVTPTFKVTPGSVVTLNGEVQTSGVSKVNLSNSPVTYMITRNFGSFKITTKVGVNVSVF